MRHLSKFVLTALLFLTVSTVYSQFGVRLKYNNNNFSGWNKQLKNNAQINADQIFSSNFEAGIDYWFRLKNQRVEFMPEIFAGIPKSSGGINDYTPKLAYYGLNFNTQIYAFDLEGDCDCPTFSKQGPSLKKGFYFAIVPALLLANFSSEAPDAKTPVNTVSNINFRIGLGIGYDIGISDLFTISPSVLYNKVFGNKWDGINTIADIASDVELSNGWNQLQFQLRLGFRPDYVKSYGRRR